MRAIIGPWRIRRFTYPTPTLCCLLRRTSWSMLKYRTRYVYSRYPLHLTNFNVCPQYSDVDAYSLFIASDLRPVMRWTNTSNEYSLWLLERPAFTFPLLKQPHAEVVASASLANPFGVPTLNDFKTMWQAWDTITMGMIPRCMLLTKPIDLRHICLFYLGHIPAFLDIHLSRLLGEPHTEPAYFKNVFEVRRLLMHLNYADLSLERY